LTFRANAGKLREVLLSPKTKLLSNSVLLLTQYFICILTKSTTFTTNHEAMTPTHFSKCASNESAHQQYLVSQVQRAKKFKYTVYSYVVNIFAFSLQNFLYVIRRNRTLHLRQNLEHTLSRLSYPVASTT
jgi:hypothetical protein